jgi:hypothetical protein
MEYEEMITEHFEWYRFNYGKELQPYMKDIIKEKSLKLLHEKYNKSYRNYSYCAQVIRNYIASVTHAEYKKQKYEKEIQRSTHQ